jgi:hypothetical protein
MKNLIYILLFGFLISNSFAQNKISKLHAGQNIDCATCHVCKTPTKKDPCLAACPRVDRNKITFKAKDVSKTIEIKSVTGEKDLYGTVIFSHKAHAEMAEMGNGCISCHHSSVDGTIEKCSVCHVADRANSNPNIPDLKSAYHRQCMDCHQTWEAESKCESCHSVNSSYKSDNKKEKIVNTYKAVVRPETKVYETGECEKGKLATFHHNDHINLFGLECVDCHQDQSCESCHSQKPNFKKTVEISNHSGCESCHDTENKRQCVKCHSDKETKSFNHAVNTGFDLNKYHSKNSCQSCHKKKGSYKGLNSKCQNCHSWDEDNFNHSITGLKLDENHIDSECGDCHEDNNYQKPTCTNCHDEDEGFTVPKKLPGKRIKK